MNELAIANSLNGIKTEVLVNFMDELNKKFIKNKVEPIEYNREDAEVYYQASYEPGLVLKIKEYTLAGGKKVNFSICIAVEYNLYYYFAFMEKHEDGF
ncbi:hypothetical protein [Clostridium chromiireducens]|uniref:Uncharacterized protein n=1 Tax=Clostridium chromiireducens TaxID=225345 RepID=A0A1V4ICX7_9CLOT|nr:hypothetical protein [Clostridium chromiireducens]OPJ57779.1 hypothetical protein CLCHR_42310 [Clostridium chromiireducens]